ncbi:unnamed protein product, partial [Diamesa hyperborea]
IMYICMQNDCIIKEEVEEEEEEEEEEELLRQHPKTYSKTTALLVFIHFISIEYTEQNG